MIPQGHAETFVKSRRFAFVGLIVLAVGSLLLTACSPNANPSNSPSNSNSTSPTPSETADQYRDVQLYFVADTPVGLKLYPERHRVKVTSNLPESALELLIGGEKPFDPDYVNLWSGRPNELITADMNGASLDVDIDFDGLNVGAAGEMMAVQQLMWTARVLAPEMETMFIKVNGETIDSLAGHLDASVPFELAPAFEVIAPVTIDVPLEDASVSNPVVISGKACTFEANVAWRLLRDNVVVDAGSTLAGESCPNRSPWQLELDYLEPGIYVFRAFELSMKDGSLVAQDTKSFIVE